MEIQSAFNAGAEGFQRATERANEAAINIAGSTLANNVVENSSQGEQSLETQSAQVSAPTNVTDINNELVELKVAEYQAKASAEVVQTADEVLGTLIDVTA